MDKPLILGFSERSGLQRLPTWPLTHLSLLLKYEKSPNPASLIIPYTYLIVDFILPLYYLTVQIATFFLTYVS
jgi:hypothetical protein